MAILQNEPNIREVIAFPKTGDGRDLMMDAPSQISPEQLKELHIAIDISKKINGNPKSKIRNPKQISSPKLKTKITVKKIIKKSKK